MEHASETDLVQPVTLLCSLQLSFDGGPRVTELDLEFRCTISARFCPF